ncbi:MAG: LysE family transporter [Cyclobacteriaceae bacterium]
MIYQVLIIAFIVSYLGSIPPGTINVTTMQMTVLGHSRGAFFFALGASLTEFVYAGATVKLQVFLSERPFIIENFQIITAIVMLVLGAANLLGRVTKPKALSSNQLKGRNGFKRGFVLGILNPLTVPFWLAITAYLQSNEWIILPGVYFWVYLTGISTGTFALLLTVRFIGAKFQRVADNSFLVQKIPGIIFIVLGAYNLYDWLVV